MTRINTNVSALNAQKTLARSNAQLQESLTRLSTGLRINVGKDDPAGLIASEILRSDIVSTNKAISNSQRANQMIATADSALGQVSSLLNDIRGLVEEAANKGALSDDQIAANQLQIDSSLEAINRISQTTKFQGRGLLDGSLDFITNASSISTIQELTINQANLGAAGAMDVNVDITTAATQATITSASGDANATAVLKFAPRTRVNTSGNAQANIDIIANAIGSQYEGVTVEFASTTGNSAATYDADNNVLRIESNGSNAATIAGLVDALDEFEAEVVDGGASTVTGFNATPSTMGSHQLEFTALTAGSAYNGVSIEVQSGDVAGAASATATYYESAKRLVITLDDAANVDIDNVQGNLDTLLGSSGLGLFSVAATKATGAGDVLYTDTPIGVEVRGRSSTGISGFIHSGFSAATNATATLSFSAGARVLLDAAADSNIDISYASLGSAGDGVAISFVKDTAVTARGEEFAVWDSSAKTLQVHYKAGTSQVQDVVAAIDALDDWNAALGPGATANSALDAAADQPTATTGTDALVIQSMVAGADYNHVQVRIEAVAGTGDPVASYDRTAKELVIQVDDDSITNNTLAKIAAAIEDIPEFSVGIMKRGIGQVYGTTVDMQAVANTAATGGNALKADTVLEVAGKTGSQVFNFKAGATVNQVAEAINMVSDSTGLSASQSRGLLSVTSTEYGSKQFADIKVRSEGTAGTFKSSLSADRANGTDAVAKINGVSAIADGNTLSLNTSTLSLSMKILAGSVADFKFTISGGGAMFQLGPEVVGNQQARIGIQSMNTANLGGASGKLYQIALGEAGSLVNNVGLAASIVDQAVTSVANIRGRLGAFQRTTLDTNIKALSDTVETLTDAESSIRDADFATETAAMTRAQILVQSGLSVLSIAKSNPQNVLALLR